MKREKIKEIEVKMNKMLEKIKQEDFQKCSLTKENLVKGRFGKITTMKLE